MRTLSMLLLILITAIPALGQGKNVVIRKWPWPDKKKLGWKDFNQVDICDSTAPDGIVEWGMVNTYYSITQDPEARTVWATTILDLNQTWVCKNISPNDTLLWYFQVCWDLAELYCRKLNKEYKQINWKAQSSDELNMLIMRKKFAIEEAYKNKRLEFFQETGHGLGYPAIVRWREQMVKELKESIVSR